jgi:transposase
LGARELKAMGHEVLLVPPAYTKRYFENASHKGNGSLKN